MPHQPADATRGLRTSLLGLVVNCAMVVIKLTAGIVGHSYALVADAVESSLDIFGSFVVWHGLRISARPADAGHPYGHGRAEALAGMIVAMMLFAAAIGIAVEAFREIASQHGNPAPFTLPVLIGVVVVKEAMFRIVGRVGREIGSGAVVADSWHHRSDAITSATAAVGISVTIIGGEPYAAADECAALLASGIILLNACRLIRQPLHDLMDSHPPEIVEQARKVAVGVAGVAGVEKVLARKIGLRYLVDMHIEVEPEMSVRQAHHLAHQVKNAIRQTMLNVQDVLIHIEPHRPMSHSPSPDADPDLEDDRHSG